MYKFVSEAVLIVLHSGACSSSDNPVTLTFDVLTSRSMHADRLRCIIYRHWYYSSIRFSFGVRADSDRRNILIRA